MFHGNQLIRLIATVTLLSLVSLQASAQITSWLNGNGTWPASSRWTNGVPTSTHHVKFVGVNGEQSSSLLQFGPTTRYANRLVFESRDTGSGGFGPTSQLPIRAI